MAINVATCINMIKVTDQCINLGPVSPVNTCFSKGFLAILSSYPTWLPWALILLEVFFILLGSFEATLKQRCLSNPHQSSVWACYAMPHPPIPHTPKALKGSGSFLQSICCSFLNCLSVTHCSLFIIFVLPQCYFHLIPFLCNCSFVTKRLATI